MMTILFKYQARLTRSRASTSSSSLNDYAVRPLSPYRRLYHISTFKEGPCTHTNSPQTKTDKNHPAITQIFIENKVIGKF